MASTSFGSEKPRPGKQYRDGTQGRADADLRSDIDDAFVLVEASIAALPAGPALIADPTDGFALILPAATDGYCLLTSVGVETRLIGIPNFVNQRITVSLDVDGGNVDIDANLVGGFNDAADRYIRLTAPGSVAELVAVQDTGVLQWRAIGLVDCTVEAI